VQGLNIPLPHFDHNQISQVQDPQIRKNMIGNVIYSTIYPIVGESLAGKITGMVIDETAVNLH